MSPVLYPTQDHPSSFHDQNFVYPVVSRRSGGVSIGVNLSPSKICNFGCVYCQVHLDRTRQHKELQTVSPFVSLPLLAPKLREFVAMVQDGSLFQEKRFLATPEEKRVLKDFAFSGDGEPTLSPQFADAAKILADVRREEGLDALKLVLITNATTLQMPKTIEGCDILAQNNGEIWAKLDAGMESHYRAMNRSNVPFEKIRENLIFASKRWPMAIQTMFLARDGEKPTESEVGDYIRAVEEILASGGTIPKIQIYTVARIPVESNVAALSNEEMDALAEKIHQKTGIPISVFYSH